jgi:alpha-tubulin suppressor-like RCC1 family protein
MPRRSAARLPRIAIAFLVLALAPGLGPPAQRVLSQGTGSIPLAWGFNDRGQLGDNTTTSHVQPAPPLNLGGVTAVAGGGEHTLALKGDGTVWTWGSNEFGQLGGSAGSMCGGVPCRLAPVQVSGLSGVAAVAAGREHSLALLNNGTVMAWGRNANGQLGNSTTTNSPAPVQVVGPSGAGALSDVVAIAAGGAHSLAVRADGSVWAWGSNGSGQLGTGCDFGTGCPDSSVPVQVRGVGGTGFLTAVVALAGGGDHSLALKLDGTGWAWGFNSDGQLGNGCLLGSTCNDRTSPVQVVSLSGGTALGAGTNHSLALLAGGSPRAWGLGGQGQLGTGTNGSSSTPASPLGLSGGTALAGGGFHSLALRSDNTAWAWGAGTSGQLGNGTLVSSNTPVPVSLPRAVAVAGGGFHSLGAQASPTPVPSATPTPTAIRTPSPTATRTPTPSPTATGTTCPSQGRVAVQAVPADGGRLRVTVTVQGTGNGLQALQFAGPSTQVPSPNAQIEDAQGGLHTLPATLTLTGQPTSYTFYVRRVTVGQATTVAFTVVDNCGAWPTLVGGGPSAF